jgi:hypothetical protein
MEDKMRILILAFLALAFVVLAQEPSPIDWPPSGA